MTGNLDHAGATLHVDLDAIVANWKLIGAASAPAKAAAVVKANAYGLGAAEVAQALEAARCQDFFVAHLGEALTLAGTLSPRSTLYVLNGLVPGAEAACAAAGIVPVLNSRDQLERWGAYAKSQRRKLPAVLQVDTGMSRFGLTDDDVALLIADRDQLGSLDLRYIISHLACADTPGDATVARQRRKFEQIASAFPSIPRGLDNSAGALIEGAPHYDLVRPGIALYGGAAHANVANRVRPVVRLEAAITQLRTISRGAGVGYGLSFTATRETVLAIVPVGYADGWPRCLGNRGAVYVGGVRAPIVGRVSMDSMTVDVTYVPRTLCGAGAIVELIGPHQTIDDVARDADTISYEILTRLGSRYARVYHSARGAPSTGGDL